MVALNGQPLEEPGGEKRRGDTVCVRGERADGHEGVHVRVELHPGLEGTDEEAAARHENDDRGQDELDPHATGEIQPRGEPGHEVAAHGEQEDGQREGAGEDELVLPTLLFQPTGLLFLEIKFPRLGGGHLTVRRQGVVPFFAHGLAQDAGVGLVPLEDDRRPGGGEVDAHLGHAGHGLESLLDPTRATRAMQSQQGQLYAVKFEVANGAHSGSSRTNRADYPED